MVADVYEQQTQILQTLNIHDQLVEALKKMTTEVQLTIKESGGCDHSVGICWCGTKNDLAEAIDVLKAAGEEISHNA